MSAVKVSTWAAPPMSWIHFPTLSPNSVTNVTPTIATTLTDAVYQGAPVSQAPAGPMRYERLVAMITANVAMTTIVYAQRFHATRNPRNSPSPTVAHW